MCLWTNCIKTGTKTQAQLSSIHWGFFFQKIFRVIAVSKSGPRFKRPLSLNKKGGLCMQNEFTNGIQPWFDILNHNIEKSIRRIELSKKKSNWLYCLGLSKKTTKKCLHLTDDCMKTAWRLPDDCLTNAWRMPDKCRTTAWQLPDNCLTTTRHLPDDC